MTDTWTLATPQLECRLELRAGALHWQLVRAGEALRFVPAPLAAIHLDGQSVQWKADATGQSENQDGRLTANLVSEDGRAALSVFVELFDDMPFVRVSATLTNTSPQPFTVTHGEMLRVALPSDEPLTLFHVEQFSWQYRNDFFSQHQVPLVAGRAPLELRMGSFPSHYHAPSSCAWFALRAGSPDGREGVPKSGPGLVGGIAFNGKSRLFAENDSALTTITSTIDELAHPLAPGETFALPASFVGCFVGDWDEAGYVTQRFTEAHISPPMPDERYPWVQYNSWKYGQEINEAQQLTVLERCAELGIEVFVIDLGWARHIGDWRPNPEKFPRGLRPIAERARELGMRFGVHMALAQMSPEAPAAKEHPEWLIHTGDDYYQAGPLCLGHAPCREWLTAEILRLIDEEGIDYIIQDGEDMVKRCTRADHTHAPVDSNYSNSAQGLDLVISAIREAHPNLVIENCEDGGCMMTYRMAGLYHTSITVDNIATYATRQGVYGASYPFSPRYSVRYMQDDPTHYTLLSSIFGGPLILMQRVTDWDETQMEATRQSIELYKQARTVFRDGKIIHLLPPRNNLDGLGAGWDAIGAIASDKRRGIVMAYRAQGGPETLVIHPRGLAPGTRYHVRGANGEAFGEYTGGDLANTGLSLSLAPFDAAMLTIEAIG